MSTNKLVITASPKYTEPNKQMLIGEWSPKRYRGRVAWNCIFHKDGKTFILNNSKKYLELDDAVYLKAIEPAQGKATAFINPYTPMELLIDRAHTSITVDSDSDFAKFVRSCPSFSVDPHDSNCLFVYYNEGDVTAKKAIAFDLELSVKNFVNNTSLKEDGVELMKDFVYYFGEVVQPMNDKTELLLQLVGENGLLWNEDSKGNSNIELFKRVFMDGSSTDKDIILLCNKAVSLHVLEIKDNTKGDSKVLAYYWKDNFISTSIEGVYDYFRSDERMLGSLSNEISRKQGKAIVDNKEIVSPAASTSPNRGDMVAMVVKAVESGAITLLPTDKKPSNMTSARLEELVEEIKNKTKAAE